MPATIEARLFLVAWLAKQLGFEDNRAMLATLAHTDESWEEGQHPVLNNILSRKHRLYNKDKLILYDQNIRRHLNSINTQRHEPIRLKYFQYLCTLMTEICLDQITHSRQEFAAQLNQFIEEDARFAQLPTRYVLPQDLSKLAVWSSTGSGKTILMHLNYYQYIYYVKKRDSALTMPNNILLITPSEELSRQHISELKEAGIPCLQAHESNLSGQEFPVRVIEITKFSKKSASSHQAQSMNHRLFGDKNLLFVDEGHKGTKGDAWFETRAKLAAGGFTFEYSATFGQALEVAGREERDEDYFKHIAFDYSYYYFYADGYGKDFNVLNLPKQDNRDQLILLGNLLSLCEQILIYTKHRQLAEQYNLEHPLLLFLGSTVSGSRTDNTDITDLVKFLRQTLLDRDASKRPWVKNALKQILSGQSITDTLGRDIFDGKFSYIRKTCRNDPAKIYSKMLELIFHAKGSADLRLYRLSETKSEIGMKVGDANKFFGVISVGSASALLKKLEVAQDDIAISEDRHEQSLFDSIKEDGSPVNILMGARKFMEGWDCWRVSGMGLLNVGSAQGPMIIQLFGRGVRLRGKGRSLKRSSRDDKQACIIKPLERLNIFGINAKYIHKFREMLEKEGVDKEEFVLPIKKQKGFINAGLFVPRFPPEQQFRKERTVPIRAADGLQVSLQVSSAVTAASSDERIRQAEREVNHSSPLGSAALACIDIEALRLRLLEDKFESRRCNLFINDEQELLAILRGACSFVVQSEAELRPDNFADKEDLQEIAYTALKKYVARLYRREQKNWETHNMDYEVVRENNSNLFEEYRLRVPKNKDNEELIKRMEKLLLDVNELEGIYDNDDGEPRRIYYDKHLYLPLLINDDAMNISPPPLGDSEKEFIRQLAEYVGQEPNHQRKIFLLRNRSRGKGIGFYENSGFFPDFILWTKEKNHQKILFVEPHGMLLSHEPHKQKIHLILKEISEKLAEKKEWEHLRMDCYILSATTYKELLEGGRFTNESKEDLKSRNILFMEDADCIAKLLGDDSSP